MWPKLTRLLEAKKFFLLPAGAILLSWILNVACNRSVKVSFTTRDIIRFLIRDNPGIFSNSFLDTASASVSGTGISFSRSYIIKTRDTIIVLNDEDTLSLNPLNVVPKFPRDAGAEIMDTLVGTMRITDTSGTHTRALQQLFVTKFGYFQKLQSDAFANRGWHILGATQTFVGGDRILDSVRLQATNASIPGYARDTLIVRQNRNFNLDPLNDPQVFRVRTNPFQLKPQDSVEVRAWVKISTFDTVYVFCHINDLSVIRRIQLTESIPGEFSGGFKLSNESGLNYQFRRLAVDAIARSTLTLGSFDNEIWGIIYQVHP